MARPIKRRGNLVDGINSVALTDANINESANRLPWWSQCEWKYLPRIPSGWRALEESAVSFTVKNDEKRAFSADLNVHSLRKGGTNDNYSELASIPSTPTVTVPVSLATLSPTTMQPRSIPTVTAMSPMALEGGLHRSRFDYRPCPSPYPTQTSTLDVDEDGVTDVLRRILAPIPTMPTPMTMASPMVKTLWRQRR